MRKNLEVTSCFCEQALFCNATKVALFPVLPEDLGGHAVSGPSSIWGSMMFGEVRYVMPAGSLSNLRALHDEFHTGQPIVWPFGSGRHYDGPLPKTCPCSALQKHPIHHCVVFISSSRQDTNRRRFEGNVKCSTGAFRVRACCTWRHDGA